MTNDQILNVQLIFLTGVKQQVKDSCLKALNLRVSQVPSWEISGSIFVGPIRCLQNVRLNSDNSCVLQPGSRGTVSWHMVPKRNKTSAQLTGRRQAHSEYLV